MPLSRIPPRKGLIIAYIIGLVTIFVTLLALAVVYILTNVKYEYKVMIINKKRNFTDGFKRCPPLTEDHKSGIQTQIEEDQIMDAFIAYHSKHKSLYQSRKSPCGPKFFIGLRRLLYQNWTNEDENMIAFAPPFMKDENAVFNYTKFGQCTSLSLISQKHKEVDLGHHIPVIELEIDNNMACEGKEWHCFLCQYRTKNKHRVFEVFNIKSVDSYSKAMEFCKSQFQLPGSLAYIPHRQILNDIYPQIEDNLLGCHHIGIGNRIIVMIETVDEKLLPYSTSRIQAEMMTRTKSNHNCIITNVYKHYEWDFEDCAAKNCYLCFS